MIPNSEEPGPSIHHEPDGRTLAHSIRGGRLPFCNSMDSMRAMESRKPRGPGRPPKPENRTRTRNLVVRLSDDERAWLDEIAEFHGLDSATEGFRFLVSREHEAIATGRARRRTKTK